MNLARVEVGRVTASARGVALAVDRRPKPPKGTSAVLVDMIMRGCCIVPTGNQRREPHTSSARTSDVTTDLVDPGPRVRCRVGCARSLRLLIVEIIINAAKSEDKAAIWGEEAGRGIAGSRRIPASRVVAKDIPVTALIRGQRSQKRRFVHPRNAHVHHEDVSWAAGSARPGRDDDALPMIKGVRQSGAEGVPPRLARAIVALDDVKGSAGWSAPSAWMGRAAHAPAARWGKAGPRRVSIVSRSSTRACRMLTSRPEKGLVKAHMSQDSKPEPVRMPRTSILDSTTDCRWLRSSSRSVSECGRYSRRLTLC
eukprot:scaffold311456_cov28-Tisochrysis_lutea.AAC.1